MALYYPDYDYPSCHIRHTARGLAAMLRQAFNMLNDDDCSEDDRSYALFLISDAAGALEQEPTEVPEDNEADVEDDDAREDVLSRWVKPPHEKPD